MGKPSTSPEKDRENGQGNAAAEAEVLCHKNIYATKKSTPLKSKMRHQLTTNKWQEVAEKKLNVAELKLKNMKEKHALEMNCIEEEHKIKMEILKLELDIKEKTN